MYLKFITWIVTFIALQAPPGRPTFIPEAKETKEDAAVRHEEIAKDIAAVLAEEEPLFKGPHGRIKTASVVLAIMTYESGFMRNVDLGLGKLAKGDSGRSACMMQINVGAGRTFDWNIKKSRPALPADPPEDIEKGYTQKELIADRKKCIRAGYRIIKVSFRGTSTLPATEWLRIYASGKSDAGSAESKLRMGLALKYFSAHKPDFTDEDWMSPEKAPEKEPQPSALLGEPSVEFIPPWTKNHFVRSIETPLGLGF